ncbi:MAG: hypothetical protein GY946_28365 [bacterium]|nr:hypothetical protein [bacterium]
MTRGSPRHARAARLLLLLAASYYAAFPSALPGHALAASSTVCASECDDGSAPSPNPAPRHDESDCSFCKAGVSAAPAPLVVGSAVPLCLAALPSDAETAPPRAHHASPEAARAPPRALFV